MSPVGDTQGKISSPLTIARCGGHEDKTEIGVASPLEGDVGNR